jgi:hypothetical protein
MAAGLIGHVVQPAGSAAETGTAVGYTGAQQARQLAGATREKKGLEAQRVPDIESLVDAVDRVRYIIILLLHSCSTPPITAGQL